MAIAIAQHVMTIAKGSESGTVPRVPTKIRFNITQ